MYSLMIDALSGLGHSFQIKARRQKDVRHVVIRLVAYRTFILKH
jgi:hypothetical protein